jgi:hypothetical protein
LPPEMLACVDSNPRARSSATPRSNREARA